MSSDNTARKLRVKGYVAKYTPAPVQGALFAAAATPAKRPRRARA